CLATTRWRAIWPNTLSVPNSRTPEGSPSSRPSNIALMVVGRRSSMVSGSTETMLGYGAPSRQGGQHHHASLQPHLPRHGDYGLPRERRHAREGAPDGGACVDPHHSAL